MKVIKVDISTEEVDISEGVEYFYQWSLDGHVFTTFNEVLKYVQDHGNSDKLQTETYLVKRFYNCGSPPAYTYAFKVEQLNLANNLQIIKENMTKEVFKQMENKIKSEIRKLAWYERLFNLF